MSSLTSPLVKPPPVDTGKKASTAPLDRKLVVSFLMDYFCVNNNISYVHLFVGLYFINIGCW